MKGQSFKGTEEKFHKLGVWQLKSTKSFLPQQSSVKKYVTNGFWLPAEASVVLTYVQWDNCWVSVNTTQLWSPQVTLKQLHHWPASPFYTLKVEDKSIFWVSSGQQKPFKRRAHSKALSRMKHLISLFSPVLSQQTEGFTEHSTKTGSTQMCCTGRNSGGVPKFYQSLWSGISSNIEMFQELPSPQVLYTSWESASSCWKHS